MNASHGARYRSADPRAAATSPGRPEPDAGRDPRLRVAVLGAASPSGWLGSWAVDWRSVSGPPATNTTRFRLIYAPFSKIDELAHGDYRTMRRRRV